MNATVTLIFELLVVIELIFVEQFFIVMAMKRKSRTGWMILSNLILTVGIVLFTIFFLSKQSEYGDGGGRYFFIGVVYALPPFIFSRHPLKDRVILIFTGFSYGLMIYAIALRFAYLFPNEYLSLVMLIIQTILHCTIWLVPPIRRFLFTLMNVENFPEKIKGRLMIIVILAFCLIISFNTNLTREATQPQKLLSIVLLTTFVVLALILIFELRKEVTENIDLSSQIKIDRLTGLKNRAAFRIDIEQASKEQNSFCLIYMDLDQFKSVNDTYGHQAGDRYLQLFADTLIEQESEQQRFYRMSGDEFCCITQYPEQADSFLKSLIACVKDFDGIPFKGISYGVATFPHDTEDLSSLIQMADQRMYQAKKQASQSTLHRQNSVAK